MEILLFYVPFPSAETATAAIEQLISRTLIACGNVIPSKSSYLWDDGLVHEEEWIAILKTLPQLARETELAISELHPFEVPAILQWAVTCNQAYGQWIASSVRKN
jgi:periplasmic divalent cation tolerance protein